jgi:hypothetical protein
LSASRPCIFQLPTTHFNRCFDRSFDMSRLVFPYDAHRRLGGRRLRPL